jgi:hypothetical protein
MGKAGVTPAETRVRAGDEALAELTGARTPSGVPVKEEPVRPHRPRPGRASGGYGERRFDRPARTDRGPRRGPLRTH